MKNTFGQHLSVTLFGESHGPFIGAVADGFAPGIPVCKEEINAKLALRRPVGEISTARREQDDWQTVSGVYEGKTTGTPLCLLIPNTQAHSGDYTDTRWLARPGHADYTAYCKYHGYEDYRGGGHFSGRITAALVAVGAIAQTALRQKGIAVGTHIARCAGIADRRFGELTADIAALEQELFPVLDGTAATAMRAAIEQASADGDSVGGVLETAVVGLPAGLGEPWFDSVESLLAHGLFSVPGIKGVTFGDGLSTECRGSEYNDGFYMDGGTVRTRTNHNGGINGGITNGMPLLFRCAVKPTPSIFKEQQTVDFGQNRDAVLRLKGRHDPAIIHRARAVVDAVTALTVYDLLAGRYGTDWFGGQD